MSRLKRSVGSTPPPPPGRGEELCRDVRPETRHGERPTNVFVLKTTPVTDLNLDLLLPFPQGGGVPQQHLLLHVTPPPPPPGRSLRSARRPDLARRRAAVSPWQQDASKPPPPAGIRQRAAAHLRPRSKVNRQNDPRFLNDRRTPPSGRPPSGRPPSYFLFVFNSY